MITERPAFALPGWPTLFALIVVSVAMTVGFVALAVLNPRSSWSNGSSSPSW